jgi:hypothetical protein
MPVIRPQTRQSRLPASCERKSSTEPLTLLLLEDLISYSSIRLHFIKGLDMRFSRVIVSACLVLHRGPLAALLICLIAVAFPVWAQTQKNFKGGGSRVCRLALKLNRTTFKEKGKTPINAELKFTNRLLDEPITIWRSGFFLNHKVLIQDEKDQADAPLTALGEKYLKMFTPGGPRDGNVPLEIQPGESHIEKVPVDLRVLYKLKPGEYRVKVLYEETQPPTPLRVYSNQVTFTIE